MVKKSLACGLIWTWTKKAGRRTLPYYEQLEDLNQEVHLKLLTAFGRNYLHIIERALLDEPDFKTATQYEIIKRVFNEACGKLGSTYFKRRQRKLPQQVPLKDDPVSHRESPMATLLLDLAIDVKQIMARFSEQDRQILALHCEKFSDSEIGKKLNLDRRRVWEIRTRLVKALAAELSD